MIDREHLELTLVGDDPAPVSHDEIARLAWMAATGRTPASPRWPLLLGVAAVVLAAVLVAWSAGR